MNQTELEERLRAAYRARAHLVIRDSSPREPVDLEAAGQRVGERRRPVLAPLLAAAAVILLAVGALLVARAVNKTPPTDEALRFTTPRVNTWDGVGPGWSIALWSPTPDAASYTVYLVSPTGDRRRLMTLQPGGGRTVDLGGISTDHTRVAVTQPNADEQGRTEVVTVDLRTGARHRFTIEPGWRYDGFDAADGSTHRLESYDMQRLRVVSDSGKVLSATDVVSGVPVVVNGRPAWIRHAGRTITINAGANHVLSTLRQPGEDCQAVRPWSATAVLMLCDNGFWAVPMDGQTPVTHLAKVGITHQGGFTDYPFFLYDLVRVGGRRLALEAGSCGGGSAIAPIGPDLKPHRLDLLGPTGGAVTGVTDDAIYYVRREIAGCQMRVGTLYRYSPAQHRASILLGGARGGGTVREALTIDSPSQPYRADQIR